MGWLDLTQQGFGPSGPGDFRRSWLRLRLRLQVRKKFEIMAPTPNPYLNPCDITI